MFTEDGMPRAKQPTVTPSELIEVEIVDSDAAIPIEEFREMWFDHPEGKVQFVGEPWAPTLSDDSKSKNQRGKHFHASLSSNASTA